MVGITSTANFMSSTDLLAQSNEEECSPSKPTTTLPVIISTEFCVCTGETDSTVPSETPYATIYQSAQAEAIREETAAISMPSLHRSIIIVDPSNINPYATQKLESNKENRIAVSCDV